MAACHVLKKTRGFLFPLDYVEKNKCNKIKNTMSTKNAEDVHESLHVFQRTERVRQIYLPTYLYNKLNLYVHGTQIANWNNDFLIFKVHYRWHQSFLNMSDGLMSISVQLKDEDFQLIKDELYYTVLYALTLLSLHFELYFQIVMLYLTVLIPLRSVFCLWRVTGQCKCQFTSEIKHIFHI